MDFKPLNNKNKVHAQLQLLATDDSHQSFSPSKPTACLLPAVTALSYLKPHDRTLMAAEEIWVSHRTLLPTVRRKRCTSILKDHNKHKCRYGFFMTCQ